MTIVDGVASSSSGVLGVLGGSISFVSFVPFVVRPGAAIAWLNKEGNIR
jgi:hypothetical protein